MKKSLNERELEVAKRYSVENMNAVRCKGATLFYQNKEYYLLKEYTGTIKHLEFEENLLNRLGEYGDIPVDSIIRDQDGNLINEDCMGKKYILRKWYMARDCEWKNEGQVVEAVKCLARLHNIMNKITGGNVRINDYYSMVGNGANEVDEFEKHNRELKRTRNFIRKKRNKNEFELMVLSDFDRYFEIGEKVCELAKSSKNEAFIKGSLESGRLVHGAYNYHNILFSQDVSENMLSVAEIGNKYLYNGFNKDICIVTNFEKSKCGVQIRDLYDFVRKVMEKYSWNINLGKKLIQEYNRERPIANEEFIYLKLKFMYPEKYWKILNHYHNSSKSWLPDKDINKFRTIKEQQRQKNEFVRELF